MIIAVIGPSSRGAVACELAKHLKFHLIDQDDIIPTLKHSLPSSSAAAVAESETLNDLFFKLVIQIATTQVIKLNQGLIISTMLSHRSLIDKLKKLADTAAARLVIVQCIQAQDASDGYRFEGVQKFTVDPKRFVANNFLAEISGKVAKRNSTHLHALSLYNNYKPFTESGKDLHCKRCQELISGPMYQCMECNKYIFHKSCAEDPGDLKLIRQSCPKNLRASKEPPGYELPPEKLKRCETCELNNKDFCVSCRDCIFETNMEGKFLPLIINHGSHSHPLNLIMMPPSYDYKFGCCGCGELGKSISYRCYDCNFNLHVGCVLLEHTATSIRHSHNLTLVYDSLEDTYWDKNSCDFCNNERKPEQWFYYCSTCEIVAHIGCCAVDQSQ
ncbi:C1-like protein [Gossypium australe]|uniref:C1-like protein n=1 Tax=Gossypium australe TaxID=47621 RepID=A0A5B6U929_9ROSI|nr:C1-like protein [Gossypium australe]